MQLDVRWDGSETPFEGDRTIPVSVIPAGAQVLAARVTVSPVDPGGGTADPEDSFVERIRFSGGGPRWGANLAHGADFVEVDFRTRRTLSAVTAVQVANGTLQIDPGGAYVEINKSGAIRTPGDLLFTLTADGRRVLPSFVAARFKITNTGMGASAPDLTEVEIRSVPENVSLRLGDQPPFHTFLGPMTDPETSGDFSALLTEFLQTARVQNGQYVLPLVVHSDTIARLDVAVTFEILQAHQPLMPGVGESVMEFSVEAIPVGAATSFRLELPAEAQAVPGRTAVRFQGAFDDTRIALGPLAPVPTPPPAAIVSTPTAAVRPEAQAQPFALPDRHMNITGIDLLLMPTTVAAEVRVDIRDDLGGKPGSQSLLPAPLKIELHQKPSASPQWVTVELPAELHLEKGRPLWLVVQRSVGDATWSVRPATADGPALEQTEDGGLSWQQSRVGTLARAEALFRLRHRPPAFTMPIHVFVGEGDDRREVPLAQFEPLGRVDFTLDTEEFAATINQVLSASAARACHPVEHLSNGDLEEWLRIGETPGTPRTMAWDDETRALALAVSPDALYFYTVQVATEPERGLLLKTWDAMCLQERHRLVLTSPGGLNLKFGGALAVAPGGGRLFASAGDRVWLVNLTEQSVLGNWAEDRPLVGLAAGGGRLFMAKTAWANAVGPISPAIDGADVSAIEAALRSNQAPQSETFQTLTETPHGVAVTPDGERVAVVFAPDAGGPGSITVYEGPAARPSSLPLSFRPSGVALTSNLARGAVGDVTHSTIRLLDVARLTVSDPGLSTTVSPAGLGMAAISADRLVAFGEGASERQALDVTDFGAPVPRHWDITAGQVTPVCLGEPFHIGAFLGQTGDAGSPLSAFSQVIAVEGGCVFDFQFWGLAVTDGAAGEVLWRAGDCTAARLDTVPIKRWDPKTQRRTPPRLMLHRVRLQAPAGARQAEVRFRASDGVLAVVDLVSLKPPDGPVDNTDLLLLDDAGVPEGWTLEPTGAPGFQLAAGTARNLGLDPLTLFQEVSVREKEAFRLEFRGQVTHEVDRPSVAVHWLDVEAPPVTLTLDAAATGARFADGTVPQGATRAEVSLALPRGSEVTVEHLAMRLGVTTGVLFSVFAEAPGSLTVSQFQVVTDKKPPTPPSLPDEGACPSTKPGDDCASDEKESHYCPSCRSEQNVRTAREAVLEGRPARLVQCGSCAAPFVRNVGRMHATRRPLALPRFAIARRVEPPGARRARLGGDRPVQRPTRVAKPSPLLAIRGLSPAELRLITQAGVTTVAQLAELDLDVLAGLLPSQSVTRARLLQGLARRALEAHPPGRTV